MSPSGHCVRSISAVCLADSAAAGKVPADNITAPRKAAKAPEGKALPGDMVRPLQPDNRILLQNRVPLTSAFSGCVELNWPHPPRSDFCQLIPKRRVRLDGTGL